MKKTLSAALLAALLLCLLVPAMAEGVKIGQVEYAAHGTKCFAVLTVAMQDDVIADAYIDEFQFMAADSSVGVPNSDAGFGFGRVFQSGGNRQCGDARHCRAPESGRTRRAGVLRRGRIGKGRRDRGGGRVRNGHGVSLYGLDALSLRS